MSRKTFFIVAALVVVFIAVSGFYFWKFPIGGRAVQTTPDHFQAYVGEGPVVTKVALGKTPKYFPSGVFMEKDARLAEGSNTFLDNGQVWATSSYYTHSSADAISRNYENYLKSLDGWVITQKHRAGNQIFLSAGYEKDSLIINISDKSPGDNLVSITFIKGR
ncbi:MAG: hypothetical protein Q7S32_01545 [bacterium]|nr:hypothetical protein [bacterium]